MIGAALTRRLVDLDWHVETLARATSSGGRLDAVRDRIAIHAVAWEDVASLEDAVRCARPDVVFHLAGPPFNPPPPLETYLDAIAGNTGRLLAALERAGSPAHVVFAGSAAVYGAASGVAESHPLEPATWLGAAKAMAGTLLAAATRTTGRPTVELRLYTPYGPGDRPERLIPSIIAAVRAGRPVPLSAGEQERDFVYIDDVIDAFVAAAEHRGSQPAAYNIGSGSPTKVRELARLLLDLLGAPELARFGAIPNRPDEIMHMAADITAARRDLHWQPRVTLSDGLSRTIDRHIS